MQSFSKVRLEALGNSWNALHQKREIYLEAKAVEEAKEIELRILEKTDGLQILLDVAKKYLSTHGNLPPATNFHNSLNTFFNYSFSLVGIKTNQKQADKIKEIIEKSLQACKANFSFSAMFIADALKNIKNVYDELVKEGKATGTLGTAIATTFKDYNIPLDDNGFKVKLKQNF